MDLKVDELLATIRRSVDNDMESLVGSPGASLTTESRGTLMRGALREMRVRMDPDAQPAAATPYQSRRHDDIDSLRERIRRNVEQQEYLAAAQPAPPTPASLAQQRMESGRAIRGDFSDIMALPPPGQHHAPPPELRPSLAHRDTQDYYGQQQPQWHEPPQQPAYEQPVYEQPRGGYGQPLLSAHAEAATDQAFRQLSDTLLARATGDRTIEDMTRDLLRTMIKQWLDANLPALVEDMVREEIERVARRGR